jgi:hypothetical protein
LEDVFLHFLNRFEALPAPRSVAEIKVTTDEFGALKHWFSECWGKPRMWCEDTFQIRLANQAFASPQEMYGALLLILASEVCRANSNEDGVWPAVTAVLKADKVSFPALFVAGQPTTACKKAMAAGARRLNLRNLIDRYGAQEYFDTLKLQFGFTRSGAYRKLPEWLYALPPIAVRILTGAEPEYQDLRSGTFTSLWAVLQDFRHDRVSGEYTSAILQESPWIRPEWAPELMTAAKLRPTRPPALSDVQEILDHSNERACEMLLRWEYPSRPRLSLRLNEERIYEVLGESDTAIFAIDGRVVDRWTAQEGGGWRGRRELPCQPPDAKDNLRPKLLSISSAGILLEEVDLLEMGTGEPLLVFDLKLGTPVGLTATLDQGRDYALICDADLSVPGAAQYLRLKDRSAYRLASPWRGDVQVVCGGAQYWQPRIAQREPPAVIRLALESLPGEIAEIGSDCRVNLTGVPEDATVVSLIAGGSSYSMTQQGSVWQTGRPLRITLGMALGEERIRIRVSTPDCAPRTITPKLSLSFRGIACLEAESSTDTEPKWTLLNRNRPLNRAGGSGKALVFAEVPQSRLFEGPRLVRKIGARALPLADLCGWGAPLIISAERQPRAILVESVVDYGRGKFLPPLFSGKTAACLSWQTSTCPSNGHQMLVWSDLFQRPRSFGAAEISSQLDDTLWRLPGLESVAALAVVYKGARIASYWHTELTIQSLRNPRLSTLFPLLRWLKVPILNSSFRAPMQQAVLQAPAEFVRAWLGAEALQYGLVHQEAEQGLDSVIRELLWDYADRNDTRIESLARAFPADTETRSDGEAFRSLLCRLGDICPSLSYNFARSKLRGDKYRKYARAVAAAMLQLPPDGAQLRDRLTTACRDCAGLIGIAPGALEANVAAFGAYLDNQAPNYKQGEAGLRALGETLRGRQFITASLLLRLVERSRF